MGAERTAGLVRPLRRNHRAGGVTAQLLLGRTREPLATIGGLETSLADSAARRGADVADRVTLGRDALRWVGAGLADGLRFDAEGARRTLSEPALGLARAALAPPTEDDRTPSLWPGAISGDAAAVRRAAPGSTVETW